MPQLGSGGAAARCGRLSCWARSSRTARPIPAYRVVLDVGRFSLRLATGKMLVLEVKGQDTQQNRTKREFLAEWVKAVNEHGGFGQWACDVSFDPANIPRLLAKQATN